ncbi:MAG: GNAT family N-acetyltransferase [Clostridiales bacterium]|nr:GNAT family N-acetyltransferase [Clostridiales bacterium]
MNVAIVEMSDTDHVKANEFLNFDDSDAEFYSAFRKKKNNLFSIFSDDKLVGAAQIEEGKKAFTYVFIDPTYRCKGIGSQALHLCELKLGNETTEEIVTTYNTDNVAAKSFANKSGYARKFSSTYMKYEGQHFDIPELSIRDYRDEDYESAHEMYALAFHEMRVSTGDFPDSVIEQASDKMREFWAKTINERLVYIKDGEIVGYARLEENEIASVSIKSENQGQGIGRNFMKYICNKILSEGNQSVDLFCVVGNKAKNLYDSLGFKEIYTAEFASKLI